MDETLLKSDDGSFDDDLHDFDWSIIVDATNKDNDEHSRYPQDLSTSHVIDKSVEDSTERSNAKRSRPSEEAAQLSNTAQVFTLRRKKKPKGMPKRPLSAYNIFFQMERPDVLESGYNDSNEVAQARVGFQGLGKIIGKRWKALPEDKRKRYEALAEQDSIRYRKEMEDYNNAKRKRVLESGKVKKVFNDDRSEPVIGFAKPNITPGLIKSDITVESRYKQSFISQPIPLPIMLPSGNVAEGEKINSFEATLQSLLTPPHYKPFIQDSAFPQATVSFPQPNSFLNPVIVSNDEAISRALPLPQGTEITIPDSSGVQRRYKLHYSVYSMPRHAAEAYVESFMQSQRDQQLRQHNHQYDTIENHHHTINYTPSLFSAGSVLTAETAAPATEVTTRFVQPPAAAFLHTNVSYNSSTLYDYNDSSESLLEPVPLSTKPSDY